MKKIIYILFFVFLISIGFVYAQELFPIQVYGDITPVLPQEYGMSFQINGVEYTTGVAETNYGYNPYLVKIPVDENTTGEKEGYARGDTVEVYINEVLVDSQTYEYLPIDAEYVPYEINISLTTEEYNQITGTEQCTRSTCTSDACQTSSACSSAGCSWSSGACTFPAPTTSRSGGGGGSITPGCYDEWNCTDEWSECSVNGIQTRNCTNIGTCKDIRPTKTETQNCIYTAPVVENKQPKTEPIPVQEPTTEAEVIEKNKGISFLWWLLALVLAVGFGVTLYELEKSKTKLESEKTMHHKELPDETYAKLEDYVKKTLDEGYTKAQIKRELIKEGWSSNIVSELFSRMNR